MLLPIELFKAMTYLDIWANANNTNYLHLAVKYNYHLQLICSGRFIKLHFKALYI